MTRAYAVLREDIPLAVRYDEEIARSEVCAQIGKRRSGLRNEILLTVDQRGSKEKLRVSTAFYEADLIGAEFSRSIMDELVSEGVLEKDGDGLYSLSNWRDCRFDFSF